ncbi:uncharacterized protein LOC144941177 [Lampetra fluviatilis]
MAQLSKSRALLAAWLAMMIVGRLVAQEQRCNNDARQCLNPERRKAAEQVSEMNKEWYRSRGVRPISRYGKRQMRFTQTQGVGAVPLAMIAPRFYKPLAIRFAEKVQEKPQQFWI